MNIFTVSQFQGLSLDGNPTIEFKDRRLEFLADSATGLMFYDIQDIIDGYDCTGDRIITHVSYLFVGGFVFVFLVADRLYVLHNYLEKKVVIYITITIELKQIWLE